jgi:DNA-binding GntR family transcriptional regulator
MEPEGALEPASLVELSLRRVRRGILSGVLPPGERLIEEQLTQRFGISRAAGRGPRGGPSGGCHRYRRCR